MFADLAWLHRVFDNLSRPSMANLIRKRFARATIVII
jgi:hypothetical protein